MKNMRFVLMVMIILLASTATVYAHKMFINPVEDGVIEVLYDDGSFSSRTEVEVYNSKDEIITSGKLDDEGKFTYDVNEDAAYIVADDGMGHRDEWKVGEEVDVNSGGSRVLKIGAVVVAFVGVAIGYSYRKKSKQQ